MKHVSAFLVLTLSTLSGLSAADQWGLERGTPEIQSAGALAFGPDDVLFVGDARSASVFAIATSNREGDAGKASINIDDLGGAINDVLGGEATISDLVVNPATGNVFISATVDGKPAIVQVNGAGRISEFPLKDVRFSKVQFVDAPADKEVQNGRRRSNPRNDSITDLAFFEGKVLVSGLRDGASPSSVREIAFPFAQADKGVGIQIFHAAHGREEDYAALRTFVPLMIDGEPNLLAAYVCTPLVKIPLKELDAAGERLRATTVAELGNRNRPLDMISYEKEGKRFLLLSNSARGVMKITTDGLSDNQGLTEPVRGGGKAGQSYETVESMSGVVQMDKLNENHAVLLLDDGGKLSLKTVPLP